MRIARATTLRALWQIGDAELALLCPELALGAAGIAERRGMPSLDIGMARRQLLAGHRIERLRVFPKAQIPAAVQAAVLAEFGGVVGHGDVTFFLP